MTELVLTDAQRWALMVLANAQVEWGGKIHRRPVRISNRTTAHVTGGPHLEMLTIQHNVADQLVEAGLVRVVNEVIQTVELTDAGREAMREDGFA